MNDWLDDLEKYDPKVAEHLRESLKNNPNQSLALAWLKSRRAVYSNMYQAVSSFSGMKFNGRRG